MFDVDGTLVDSSDLHARAWLDALRHFGKNPPYDLVRQQIGRGGDQTLPVFLSPEEIQRFGAELDRYKSDTYRGRYMPQVRPFPKVRELFERIHRDGKRIALATSAASDELRHNLGLLHVDDLVDAMTSEDDARRTKPFPDIFLAALGKLGDPAPESVMVVGDSTHDAEAAAQVPLPMIGLLCGGYSEQQLREKGCVAIYRDPADLLEQYEKSPLAK
jgi:HAD superfamily hydrolase (TIGR01509 family)